MHQNIHLHRRVPHGALVRLERSAVKVCAVVRTDGIATTGGRRSRQVTPRRTTDLDPKGRGDKSMLVKQEISEGVYDMVLQRLRDMAKGEFPESQCPGVEPHTRRDHACSRRHREPAVRLSPLGRLARWPMRNECIQGHEWGAYVVLGRSSVMEHGMAYGPRGLGSRSANSSRGRNVPPGSAGKPRAGRSGAGGRMSGTGEVRAMRNAKAGPPSIDIGRERPLESGLRSKDLRAVRRGAVGKVPVQATRWRPTLRSVRFLGL
jgi:hypothetical protein